MISCFIADDHPAVLQAVADTVEGHGFSLVGSARDGEEALRLIENLKPDVALLDLKMPRIGGIEIARRLTKEGSPTATILYTAYGDRPLLNEALDAGARGFILKEAPLVDLVRAIETVADGHTYVDPILAGVLAQAQIAAETPKLTKREREVLRHLSDGLTNEEIGKKLFISPETVRTHVRKAMAKLDADTRTQAVATALRQSLIS